MRDLKPNEVAIVCGGNWTRDRAFYAASNIFLVNGLQIGSFALVSSQCPNKNSDVAFYVSLICGYGSAVLFLLGFLLQATTTYRSEQSINR